MKKKLLSKTGFSLSELLMVVLILSFLVILIASGTGVVTDAYNKITLKAEAQTLMSTTVSKVRDEFRFARDIEIEDIGSKETQISSFVSGNLHFRICFKNDPEKGILIQSVAGDNASMAIVSDKTMTSKLFTSIAYQYQRDKNQFVAKISIGQKSKDEQPAKNLLMQEIKVKPLN